MNLRQIANRATSGINPNVAASVQICTGYTTGSGLRRDPSYAPPAPLTIQMQALSKKEVEHLDAMGISNAVRAAYANLQLTAADRKMQSGGDLVTAMGDVYLVTAVLEGWTTAGWCKVALTKQTDAAA